MHNKRLQKILIIILSLVLIRGLIYGLLIPVDRTPDEIRHFMLVKAKQLALSHRYEEEEGQIAAQIQLARQNLLYPESANRRSLSDFEGVNLPTPPSSLQLYYLSTAWILRVLSLENVRDEIYVIRGLSIVIGTFVVFLAFLVARELFPDNPFIIIGVPTLIAFIPQFSAMNGSINNDKLAELFVSLCFLFMVKVFKQGMITIYFAAIPCTMWFALLGKRSTFFVLPVFLMFVFVYWWKSSLGLWMHVVLAGIILGVTIGGLLLLKYSSTFEELVNNGFGLPGYKLWLPEYKLKEMLFRPELVTIEAFKYYAKFFIVLYWSFWGVFGYMTIHLHHMWYALVAVIQSFAICGIFWFIIQVNTKRVFIEKWKTKSLYVFVTGVVFAVVIPFFYSVVLRPGFPQLSQGRYLFAAIIPIGVLTVFGLSILIPSKWHRVASIVGILGLIVLDSVCLSKYLLLNFHLISLF